MRKILTSVLSVAGLLAVVLALASSPASAAKEVVTFQTQADGSATAGVWTISWETAGGCDPGAGTSGASGSITITVSATNADADLTGADGLGSGGPDGIPDIFTIDANSDGTYDTAAVAALVGNQGEEFVTVNDDCTYKWSGSVIEAAQKAVCSITGLPGSTSALTDLTPAADVELSVVATNCAAGGLINVVVGDTSRTQDKAAVLCGADRISGGSSPDTEGPCAVTGATADTVKTAATYTNDGVTDGAIKETAVFVVTATPVPNSKPQCQPVTGETSRNRAGSVSVRLFVTGNSAVVEGRLTRVNCKYDIEVALPPGFTGGDAETNKAQDIASGGNPGVTVAVATRNVYLIQDVDGDADGAYATYRFTTAARPDVASTEKDEAAVRCVAGLPAALTGVSSGGIITSTTVELREGRFNINAAVNNGSAGPVLAYAMDHKAVPCHASATVKNLPDHCSASNPTNAVSANLVTDADGEDNVLVEHVITCTEPAAEQPAADDMGSGDMGGDDMGAGDDMGGDDMGADDMGADDMGGDDMGSGDMNGPPADNPTG